MAETPKKTPASIVVAALKGIPDSIKDLFVPTSIEEIKTFEQNVMNFSKRSKERDEVMGLQRKYGLPLRPNASYTRTMLMVRLKELKRKKQNPQAPFTDSQDTL